MSSVLPIVVASLVFLVIGMRAAVGVRTVADFLPLERVGKASVKSSREFSASTVATTVSLATIVAAYFGLANYFGLWLLWTAVTGALGMFVVYLFAGRISAKLDHYNYRPSIHEFLATEFSNASLKRVSAALTVIGLMLLLATELLVGSRFLGDVILGPDQGSWLLAVSLSVVAVTYVLLGGFSTVIRTDRLQMIAVWLMILILGIIVLLPTVSGIESNGNANIPAEAFRPVDAGLLWFLVGIFLMNVPTHLSSVTVFQRMAACEHRDVLRSGLLRSSGGIMVSWGFLVIVAWLASRAGGATGGEVLRNVLSGDEQSALTFILMVGLYCALLSTASTLLIAIGHTFTTDIIGSINDHKEQNGGKPEIAVGAAGAQGAEAPETSGAAKPPRAHPRRLLVARVSIAASATLSCGAVAGLNHFGFQVEDLIFSIYGGALALFPPILVALLSSRRRLSGLSRYALAAVVTGFLAGWGIAFYGKINDMQTAVFMSPAVGMCTSMVVLTIGLACKKARA